MCVMRETSSLPKSEVFCATHHASRFTSSQPVKLPRQLKILFRQSARVMRRERERDLVPADINVGMMPRLLCELGDGVDEFHRSDEVLELKRARDGRTGFLPIRQSLEAGLDPGRIEFCHGALMTQRERRVTQETLGCFFN